MSEIPLSEKLRGIVPSIYGDDLTLHKQQRAALEAAAQVCKAAEELSARWVFIQDMLAGTHVPECRCDVCGPFAALNAAVLAGGTPR